MEQDMQNNKPGNTNWKDKLDDAGDFTQPLLDKEAAWDSLHNRLQQRRRRKPFWFSIAAACLLLMIALPLLLPTHPQQAVIKDAAVEIKKLKQIPISTKENAAPLINVAASKKKLINSTILKEILAETAAKYSHEKIAIAPVSSQQETVVVPGTPLPAAVIQELPVTTTALQTLAGVPVKKVLKVVHVNELGNPAEDQYRRRVTTDYSGIQFGFTSQQTYQENTIPSNKIGINISTGKNNPSN